MTPASAHANVVTATNHKKETGVKISNFTKKIKQNYFKWVFVDQAGSRSRSQDERIGLKLSDSLKKCESILVNKTKKKDVGLNPIKLFYRFSDSLPLCVSLGTQSSLKQHLYLPSRLPTCPVKEGLGEDQWALRGGGGGGSGSRVLQGESQHCDSPVSLQLFHPSV